MKLTKLQFLNITTGVLHTSMDDIHDFFNQVITDGIFSHMLPAAYKAIKPIIYRKYPDYPKEGYYPDYSQEEIIVELTDEEKKEFWQSFINQPSPLYPEKTIVVKT